MKRILSFLLSLCAVISAYADDDVIEIWTASSLMGVRTAVNTGTDTYAGKTVKLMADIDLGSNWTPIGTRDDAAHSFRGTFDGQGYTITYKASTPEFTSSTVLGLFGYLRGTVQHLKVKGAVINTDETNTSSTAGIAAYNRGTISECANLASIVGTTAGGIAGVNKGTITNCYNQGYIGATDGYEGGYYLGGIAGANDNATISYSYASCTMDDVSTTDGITGNNINSGTIIHSYYHVLLKHESSSPKMKGSATLTSIALNGKLNTFHDYTVWTFTIDELPELTCFKNKIVRLSDTKNNSAILSNYNGQTCTVELNARTLTRNNEWNTLCLPFNIKNIDASPLAGATIKELDADGTSLSDEGKLTLKFKEATSIEAGKPYLIKWETTSDNIVNPVFTGVTITNTAPTAVTSTDSKVTFVGQYSPFGITASNIDEIILISTGNRMGYSKNARTLKCFRCHFEVPNEDGAEAPVRSFVLDFGKEKEGVTEVKEVIEVNEVKDETWWTLSGVKLESKPSVPGIYIHNGKKEAVR